MLFGQIRPFLADNREKILNCDLEERDKDDTLGAR